jgi:hypothetical protein
MQPTLALSRPSETLPQYAQLVSIDLEILCSILRQRRTRMFDTLKTVVVVSHA